MIWLRLGYAQGVDFGISPLGDVVEAYGSNNQYGGPHNSGKLKDLAKICFC